MLWSLFPDGEGELYISRFEDVSTHDNNFLSTKECLGVFCSSQCQVSERANGRNGDGVWLIFTQKSQDLLVTWLEGRGE